MENITNTNTEPIVILGTYEGYPHSGILEWTCPIENIELRAWGEFQYDQQEHVYIHHVYGDQDQLLYIVKA